MTPELLCSLVIRPVLSYLDWQQPRERELLLCAIALQESGLQLRKQNRGGPARSWWQMEAIAVNDTLRRCRPVAELCDYYLCLDLHEAPNIRQWSASQRTAIELSDLGACAIAAGILRLHPGELPAIGKQGDAWRYYEAAWRPGNPGSERWPASYTLALKGHQEHYGGPLVKREP